MKDTIDWESEAKKYKSLYDKNLTPDDDKLLNMLSTNGKSEVLDETLKTHMSFGTKQYAKFSRISGNHDISDSHVNTLVDKIKKGENFLKYCPIMVDEQMRILDGQHRFFAAKRAGVHIWYNIVVGKVNLDTVARINESQKKWQPSNFIHMYADMGYVEYRTFEEFISKDRGYHLSPSTGLLLFGNQSMKTLRTGDLQIVDLLYSEKIADALLDVQKYVKFATYNRFANAFKRVFEHDEYDHKRMLSKLEQRRHTIKKLTTVTDYIRLLEGIYNYKLSDANKVRFF